MVKINGLHCGIRKLPDIDRSLRSQVNRGGVRSLTPLTAPTPDPLVCIAWNGGSIFTYYYTIVFTAAGITDPHVQFGISGVQNASWCLGGIVGGYLLDIWGRRTNYLIGTGQACLCLIIQGALTIGIFDKGKTNHAAGVGFVSIYVIQWFLWVMFFSPGQ